MPRKSSLKRLPAEILDEINRLLSENRCTLDEILSHLRAMGVDSVSRSALGRHKRQMDKVIERLRQSRDMADAIAQKLGPEAVEGRQGRALVQMLSAMAGEYMLRRMDDPGAETEAREIVALARAVKDAAQASRYSQDFELKIRDEARKEAEAKLTKAVDAVTTDPASAALSPAQMRERLLAAYRGEV